MTQRPNLARIPEDSANHRVSRATLPESTQIGPKPIRAQFWFYCQRASYGAKERAQKYGVPYAIDAYTIDELLVRQNYRCAVSGIPFEPPARTTPLRFRQNPFGPSLDRIVPDAGYVAGNIRITCVIVNTAMNEWGLPALLRLVEAMARGSA